MRYLIFGSGAVGSYLGVTLAHAGHHVSFLTRPGYLDPIRQHGFTLTGVGEERRLPDPVLYSDAARAIEFEKPDLILLTVKAYDVSDAAKTLATLLQQTHTVVSFLNGISNEATLAAEFGAERILPATLTTAVQMPEPGLIRAERVRGIGLGGNHPRLSTLARELEAAGFSIKCFHDADAMKWSKLLTNIVSNATSAILGWPASKVFDHPLTAELEIRALREAVRVMRAAGHQPQNLPGVQVGILARAVFLPSILTRKILGGIVSSGRGQKKPSLHYDLGRGRSEISWLNGAVVKFGRQLGVPTPVNDLLTRTLLDLVHKRRPQDEFFDNPQSLFDQLIA